MSLMKRFLMKNKLKINIMITDKIVAKQFKTWARKFKRRTINCWLVSNLGKPVLKIISISKIKQS